MEKFLPVSVYSATNMSDSSANGVTKTHADKIVVPCEGGFLSRADVEERGCVVLVVDYAGGEPHLRPESADKTNDWVMFGGNFVYTSDSRFGRQYGRKPMPVHDRIEQYS